MNDRQFTLWSAAFTSAWFLLDRADQYETDSACWVALADLKGEATPRRAIEADRMVKAVMDQREGVGDE